MAEAEPAVGRVELVRGDTEVEQRTVEGRGGHDLGNFRSIGKIGLHGGEPVAEGGQTPGRVFE